LPTRIPASCARFTFARHPISTTERLLSAAPICKIGANESSEASATPEESTAMVQWRVGDSVDYEVIGPRQKRSRRRRRTRSLDATSPRARRDGSHRSTARGIRATSRAVIQKRYILSTRPRNSSRTRSRSRRRTATTSRASARARAADPRPPPKRRSPLPRLNRRRKRRPWRSPRRASLRRSLRPRSLRPRSRASPRPPPRRRRGATRHPGAGPRRKNQRSRRVPRRRSRPPARKRSSSLRTVYLLATTT